MSITIEAAELMELFQWRKNYEIEELIETSTKYMDRIKEELADILIYAFSLSNALNIDVATIVEKKIKFNEEKYPVDKYHGKF